MKKLIIAASLLCASCASQEKITYNLVFTEPTKVSRVYGYDTTEIWYNSGPVKEILKAEDPISKLWCQSDSAEFLLTLYPGEGEVYHRITYKDTEIDPHMPPTWADKAHQPHALKIGALVLLFLLII